MSIKNVRFIKSVSRRYLFIAAFAVVGAVATFSISSCEKGHAQPAQNGPPFSSFRRAGGLVFISGRSAVTSTNGVFQLIPGLDFEGQVKTTMDMIADDLRTADLTFADAVSVTIYLRDLKDYAKMNTVYRTYFPGGNFPARATFAVKDLLGNADIEISVTAKDR